jgi:HK97 family phage major capsid protein
MANLLELRRERETALTKAEALSNKTNPTAEESKLFEIHMEEVKALNEKIKALEASPDRTILKMDFRSFLNGGSADAPRGENGRIVLTESEGRFKAAQFRTQFAAWMNKTLASVGGLAPTMEAAAPSGAVSIGSGSGEDSIGVTVPVEVLPYLPSYYNLDSFALAGASQIYTPHTRPLVKPIISAGAADSAFAENAAPTTSQPFGLSSFTFGGTKYARLVLASYEALMNSELPLQGVILDELLASLATTLTTATTSQMYSALTTVGGGSTPPLCVQGSSSIYQLMIELRHAVPPRFDLPTNKWMLSRATLAAIKNVRASTSGVPMFDANSNLIFGREFVINDNFDTVCGSGFVAYGDWADGAWQRKTPVMTRVFVEAYAASGEIGYRTQQWMDSHFLAELVGAPQAPTFQPIYYTSLASAS